MLKDVFFSAVTVIIVVAIAAVLGPKGPSGPPDPTLGGANPRPEWPFLWLFALLSLSPPAAETFIILVFPVLLIIGLLLVPFLSNRGERAPSRRPAAVLLVIVGYTALGVLTYRRGHRALVAEDDGLERRPDPEPIVKDSTPLQLQGAVMLQNKNCRNCHALDGLGGRRGPDLTTVGSRLTRESAHRPDQQRHAGRRQHAGLRQADQAGRDDRRWSISSSASGRPGRRPAQSAETVPSTGEWPAMSPTVDAFLRSWPSAPWLSASSADLRGDLRCEAGWPCIVATPLRWTARSSRPSWAACATLFLAFGSPVEPFGSLLLQVHMIQHLLLMMVAPPLLWLGAPLFPMIRGIPRPIRVYWVAPVLRSPPVRRVFARLSHPAPALVLYVGDDLVLARPGRLRGRVAHRPGCIGSSMSVSSGRRSSSGTPSSGPIRPPAMVPLAAPALSADRRRLEHRPLGPADVLRPACSIPTTARSLGSRGSRRWTTRRRPACSCGCPARSRSSCPCSRSGSGSCSGGRDGRGVRGGDRSSRSSPCGSRAAEDRPSTS